MSRYRAPGGPNAVQWTVWGYPHNIAIHINYVSGHKHEKTSKFLIEISANKHKIDH